VTADFAGQAMSSIEEIEKAVANLPPHNLAIFIRNDNVYTQC
jgi:hypothetical protein